MTVDPVALFRRAFALLLLTLAVFASSPAPAMQTINGITIDEDMPQARRGVAYSHTIPISGGTGPYTVTILNGLTLPSHLTLSAAAAATGVISCNEANGNNRQDIRVTDSSSPTPIVADFTGNRGLSINVTAGPAGTCVSLTITPASLPNPSVGAAYSQTITASGGLGPYAYTVSAGALPAGLTLNASTGQISGTPATSGAYSFTITATDAADSTGSQAFSGTTNPAPTVNPASLSNGTAGTAYSQTVTASGGTGPYTFSVSAGSLPAGLALNGSSGAITGAPSTAATSGFTIRATDSLGAVGSRAYTVTINAAIALGGSLPATTQGVAYSQSISATGGTGALSFAVSAGALPSGLALNAATGEITGTPSGSGTSNFTITATDTVGATGSQSYAITVNPAIAINPASLPGATVGAAYNQSVSATGGTGAVAFAVSAGALPTGLSLNPASGAISGTPSAAGSFGFTITGTDTVGATGSRAYTVTANSALTVNPASLPAGTVGFAYSQSVSASGGSGPYAFGVTAGSLPAGLSLNASTGAITGIPTSAATSNFTVTATDSLGGTGVREYALVINAAIVVNPASLPATTAGIAYSQSVSATGGTGALAFSVTGGTLPAGVTLNAATGAISGTPASAGTSNFTITATDSIGASGSRAFSVTVNPALSVTPASLPAGSLGAAYSQTISATGGTGTPTFSVSAGSLPAGLSLNAASGLISGTPSAAGTSTFTITATDTLGATGSQSYTVTVNAAISVIPASLPATTVGVPYSQSISASGGNGSFSYGVSSGSLPAGLTLNATTGALTGTPSSAATSNFTITATDGLGATGSRAYSVVVNAALTVNPATLPSATVGSAYAQSVSATGGTGAIAFAVTSGALPSGLALNFSTGTISGTPTSAGTSNFTITATDSVGASAARAYALTVNAGVAVNPAALPATTIGVPYSQTVAASGGNGSYTFSISAGSLPAGLTLNSASGLISGTPSSTGTSNFTVTATDGLGATGSRAYSVVVNAAVAVNPASLPGGAVGAAYSQTIAASGGTGASTFAMSAGTLPAGLTLNAATGAITGTPTAAGTSNFTITATDAVGATGSRAYAITINAAIAVNPASLPAGSIGVAYSQAVSAVGGNGSFTFSVSAGSLAAGLSLNAATGAISGTPTSAATSNFTITATDAVGATGSRAYAITINAAIAINPASLPNASVGAAFSQTIIASGGSGGYTFSVSAGALPAGLTLNPATGVISGSPTSAGTANFTIIATDGLGATGSRAFSVTVTTALAINPATLPAGVVGAAYAQAITAAGGSGAYSYAVSAGSLPPGFALNAATGALGGMPAAAGSYNFSVTATDSLGATVTRVYSLNFNAAVAVGPANLQDPVVGTAFSQVVTGSGGTGAYTFTVTSGSLPLGLSLSTGAAGSGASTAVNGTLAGMPTAAGTWTFTITATDALGFAGARAYSLTVTLPSLILVSPIGNGAVGSPYNQSLNVAGGTAPYTFALSGGALPPGVALDPATGALSGVPTAPGSYTFTVVVTDANGATGTFTQMIDVVARPDPSLDPAVRGISAAQISAAARFGTAQINNVAARMRMLHLGHDPCSTQFDIGTNIRWERAPGAADAEAGRKPADERERTRCDRPFAVWAGGNVDFGFLRPSSAANRNDFRTSGLTLGADIKLRDGLIIGAAIGYGRDQTDVAGGSESRANAQSVALYGSFAPLKAVYIDALLGYGGLSFDSRRWQATDMATLAGDRDGSQTYGSISLSTVLQMEGLKLAPYARFDHVRSRLDGYGETGSLTAALSYGSLSVSEDAVALGLYAGYSMPLGAATIEPGLRLEQRRVRSGSADQGLAYSDMPQVGYVMQHAGESDGRTSGALSVMLRFGFALSLGFEYSYTGSSDSFRNESFRAILRAPF